MDYFTALAELGLTEEGRLTRDRVRRTYLRRLREHPPEKDPDGFKRLRSAFELLRNLAEEDDEPVAPPEPAMVASVVEVAPPVETPPKIETPPPKIETPPPIEMAPLPPLAKTETPPAPLSAVLPRMLTLLIDGNVAAAIALEEKWRQHADDIRQGWMLDLARLALVRELLGAAAELPAPVLRALAKALQRDDLSLARPELEAFRLTDPKAAGDANVLLFTRANSIFKQIEGTLFVPTPLANPFLKDINRIMDESRQRIRDRLPPPRAKAKSSGALVYAAIALIGLFLRIMLGASSSSSSYSAGYRPIQLPEFHPPPIIDFKPEMFFIPPPSPQMIYRDTTPATLTAQVLESSRVLQKYDLASDGQKQAAMLLEEAAQKHNCRDMKAALDELKAQPPHTMELRKLYADQHIDAVSRRLELICPAKKKRGK